MNRQALFDRHVAELVDIVRHHEWDEYSMLRAAGIVRALLLDESPLLWQVNRQRRRRVRFTVQSNKAYEDMVIAAKPVFWVKRGLSPERSLTNGTVRSLELDDFLKMRVAHVDGLDVTVKDVVKQLANVEGGVHPGTPKTEIERRLAELNDSTFVSHTGAVASVMHGIADVVIRECEQLVTAANDTASRAIPPAT